MKNDPNMSLYCIHAETDDIHGDCLKEDCGCSCHSEEEYEEAQ